MFTYEESRDDFNMPEDLKILEEVFHSKHGEYAAQNAYWQSYHLMDLIAESDEVARLTYLEQVVALKAIYREIGGFS